MNAKAFLSIMGIVVLSLGLSSPGWTAKAKASEDAHLSALILNAKTKADQEKIVKMLELEAKQEEAKVQSLKEQAEAYREHQHEMYGKDLADLQEHSLALARHYEEAVKRHMALAEIHRRIAAETR